MGSPSEDPDPTAATMYLSTSHGFLFVHVPKAAGSSIRTALAPVTLPRNRSLPQRVLSHLPYQQDPERVYLRTHDTAAWARVKLGTERFDGLKRYAVIRNPYDMAVSYFSFYQRSPQLQFLSKAAHADFAPFLRGMARYGRRHMQCHWVEDKDGRLIVPGLLFFERLDEDFLCFAREVGLDGVTLGRENVSGRGDYRDYYTPETRALVEQIFERDFRRFGYNFQTGLPDWSTGGLGGVAS